MKRKKIFYIITLIIGIFLGWLFFHSPDQKEEKQDLTVETVKSTIWTCAMHPQIRMHEPGKCPICGMDLIPLNQSNTSTDPDAIHLSKEAAQLANVLTSTVSRQKPVKEVRLYGKVQADERMLQSQVSYLPGRIEKLFVNYTGETVGKGQKLAVIYSPDLITAQQELLETAKTKSSQPILYEAAKDKLRQWKLTDNQIAGIESSGIAKSDFEVYANTTGIVTARRVNNGDYISPGTVLFDVADLSHVWVMFDAYESDLPFLAKGDHLTFTVQAMPGVNFSDNISFIDPVLDPVTRVAKVRVEINNQAGKLKPEMFATGLVEANLNQYNDNLIIPGTAVLWTGKRSVVYVKQTETDEPVFKMREIEVGPMLGSSYVVMNGLNEGEEIVTQGVFSVDAAAQLEGKPSMMNRQGGQTSTMPGMNMPAAPELNKNLNNVSAGNTSTQTFQHAMFGVSGNCDMCKERIEKAAKSVQGVSSADWDVKTKKIHVEYDNALADLNTIHMAIAQAGHDTEKFKASDEVYNNLPECCLYRN
ncbi:MAG: efflux RND transporter periplasmic adaptor subunit [Bacteroidales bacterium]|nr:efflux RND transporter periplasmic adaptor subunit [Bacteroidales bacterium]